MLQSTLPTGSDNSLFTSGAALTGASIHAPARGATFFRPPVLNAVGASIHAPARGATGQRRGFNALWLASIHAPARGATLVSDSSVRGGFASIHAPAQGATVRFSENHIEAMLQSTLPHGERLTASILMSVCPSFNPRSRTGSDTVGAAPARDVGASIHAPARGATRCWVNNGRTSAASIHAPARGATALVSPSCIYETLQSTLPHGERRGFLLRLRLQPQASIHAPARGATSAKAMEALAMGASIHAPARGATTRRGISHWQPTCFNPRSRAGSDAGGHVWVRCRRGFNPRSRAGIDVRESELCHPIFASIHAPARGATLNRSSPRIDRGASIHAPARGATAKQQTGDMPDCASIHAPARGATVGRSRAAYSPAGFNPRSRTGSDHPCAALAFQIIKLQSTLPHGERRPVNGLVLNVYRCFNPRSRTGSDLTRLWLKG